MCRWRAACRKKDEALGHYQALIESTRRIADDHPLRLAYLNAEYAVTEAQWRMLNLLREMA